MTDSNTTPTLATTIDGIDFDITVDGVDIITDFDLIKKIAPFTKYPDLWINAVAVYPAIDGEPAIVRAFQTRTHAWNSSLRKAIKFADAGELDGLYHNDVELSEFSTHNAVTHWTNAVIGNSVVINTSSRFSALLGHGPCDGPFCYRAYMREINELKCAEYLVNPVTGEVDDGCPDCPPSFIKLLNIDIDENDIPF